VTLYSHKNHNETNNQKPMQITDAKRVLFNILQKKLHKNSGMENSGLAIV